MTWSRAFLVFATLGSIASVVGCRVDSHKHGDSDNFKVATPFGGMQVKTNDATVLSRLGLPAYPGATLVADDKDSHAADIDMSFGSFQLRVKAVGYRTSDSPDKVKDFYRNALRRYGDVIQCAENHPVGTPTHTTEGLTCENDKHNHINVDDTASGKSELKAGSKQHQHIVGIEQESGGATKFSLVAIDLPGHISGDDKQESSQ